VRSGPRAEALVISAVLPLSFSVFKSSKVASVIDRRCVQAGSAFSREVSMLTLDMDKYLYNEIILLPFCNRVSSNVPNQPMIIRFSRSIQNTSKVASQKLSYD
jgi:hypothetical protein